FQPIVMPSTELTHDRFTRTPDKFAAYIQDKMEYENVIINVGLRLDAFWVNGQIAIDREDPNVYMPFKLDHKYKDLNGDGVIELSEQVEENEYSLEERKDFWYRAVEAKYQVSPRFGIAYPITDRGVIHFSYGIFQQIPEYSLLYNGDERKVSRAAETYGPFGNPDLNPQRTTMYELGLSQQLTNNLAINVTGFYRDIRDWISSSPSIPTIVAGVSYATRINRDFANVRGITVMVDRRLSNHFAFKGDYTLQIVEGTNSAPEDEFWAQLEGAEPTRQLAPLNWDQRHTLNLNLFFGSPGLGASILARYNSGQPYTPEILTGERVGRSIIMGLAENSRRKPPRFTVDINAFKQFQLGEGVVKISTQIYNLFDTDNPSTVYSDTGEAGYTIRQVQVTQADKGYFIRPEYYAEPHQILLGISYEF
ncbi:MAG: TonB-dependent receptor plug domain-containing protein, partial [Candidatus Neomarinimicrobiota bacterium]